MSHRMESLTGCRWHLTICSGWSTILLMTTTAGETTVQTLILDHALDLPGHEHGRQALLNALHGENLPVKVTGEYRRDTFVVTTIEDVYDADEDCWASEHGSELYPMQ